MKRVVFDDEKNPHLPVTYIRVRDEGNCIRASTKEYADEAKGIKFQRELDILVNDFDRTVSLLEIAGLKKSFFQESKREQWELEGSEICIDEWPHLKPYIEIESPNEEKLRDIAKRVGMEWDNHINGGALKLYIIEYGCTRDEAYDFTTFLKFNEPLKRSKS